MNTGTAPIFKQLEEMSEDELVEARTRSWSIAKSSSGYWVRVDEGPFRYFKDSAFDDAVEYLNKHGIHKIHYIFYQDSDPGFK